MLQAGSSFVDFVILSILYLVYVVVKTIIDKKKIKKITKEDALTLQQIKEHGQYYLQEWFDSKYLLKKIDVLIDSQPRKMLTYLTLAIMLESFIVYSLIK